ncbi:MAG: hypothetical protein J6X18_00660 [Bacteroidales bacterium]|nr:hypothetical protein [Bacteroidales bacterium]
MRLNKFKRKIQEALDKYGDIEVIQKIDYWWRDTYEGAINWKVRETIHLSDLLNYESLEDFDVYGLVKMLEHPEKCLPQRVPIEYADTKERYEQQSAEHPEEEKNKLEHLQRCFQTYYRIADRIKYIYD